MPQFSDDLIRRPISLEPVERPMSWGSETWLNGTQEDAPAAILGEGGLTLAEIVRERPEVLGRWPRLLFGDVLPIFTKFLRTRFPPRVHAGFCRAVERREFLESLRKEQAALRQLYEALDVPDDGAFISFQGAYERWAVAEALRGWAPGTAPESEAFVGAIRPVLRTEPILDLAAWMTEVQANRARIVGALNEIDLEVEAGNLLLMGAGLPHAIFGLSHQTHPLDHSREALQALYARLRRLALAGASDEMLDETVEAADLPGLRALNTGPPKNEAWLPMRTREGLLLVEPQQTSNVTYSFADFYTPFAWKDRLVFRKGDAARGLSDQDLDRYTRELEFAPQKTEDLRRSPRSLPARPDCARAECSVLVDDPSAWPFFAVREVRLAGSREKPARWCLPAPKGAFTQVVVAEGSLRIEGSFEPVSSDSRRPAFVPATLPGSWALVSQEEARALLIGVPVPACETERAGGVR